MTFASISDIIACGTPAFHSTLSRFASLAKKSARLLLAVGNGFFHKPLKYMASTSTSLINASKSEA